MNSWIGLVLDDMEVEPTPELERRLLRVEELCEMGQTSLRSRQLIALIVEQYERDTKYYGE